MILIAIVDERDGMAFNCRRQSRDTALIDTIVERVGTAPIWMDKYSAKLFGEHFYRVHLDENCLASCRENEYCLTEVKSPSSHIERIEKVVLYRWHRTYPADVQLGFSPIEAGFKLVCKREFAGSSHEIIDEEVYER